jgi:hypothetical protein
MDVSRRYVDEIFARYGYFATWLPNTRVELGDVGVRQGRIFKRLTSLADLGIEFGIRRGKDPTDFTHTSSSGVNLKLGAAADASAAGAQLAVEFDQQGAFVFQAVGCRVDEIDNRLAVGQQVLELHGQGKWDADWCVTDTTVSAASATIIVASSAKASLGLTARTPIQISSLARVDAGISVSAQAGDVLHFIAAKGLVPMFKVSRVKQSFLAKLFGGELTFGGPGDESAEEPFEPVSPA